MASSPILLLLIMATIATIGLMVAPPCAADNSLCVVGNSLSSPNSLQSGQALTLGPYVLIMQSDCNLVLYDAGNLVWKSNTSGLVSDCRLTVSNRGNLIIYDQSNNVIWQTGTNGPAGSYVLVLQQDLNVVVYGPGFWSTRTNVPAVGVTVGPHNATASVDAAPALGLMVAPPCAADNSLCAVGNSLSSPNSLQSGQALTLGLYVLIMQSDCNLVLYDAGNLVWKSDTSGLGSDCRLTLRGSGNLVIYDQSNNLIWQTGTNRPAGSYVLVLQQDRNVVVYGPGRWATYTHVPAVGVTVGPDNATASVDAAAEQVIISAAVRKMLN